MAYTRRRLTKSKPKSKAIKPVAPRRKLQAIPLAAAAFATKYAYNRYRANQANTALLNRKRARYTRNQRLEASDNIIKTTPVIIGKQRAPTFAEKVSAVDRPPIVFKRNYQFSAEAISGRKGWFSMNVNQMLADDLQTDITAYKSTLYTDGIATDSTVSGNSFFDNARFYIDSHKESIKMINSSSNSLTGKIHLFKHKRDTDNAYDGAPINPINLMMYYSTNSRSLTTNGLGGEQTVGNGFSFNTTAGVTNYAGLYNMPGSSLNATGFTASTDPTLSPMSPQIKDRVGFWFDKVSTTAFSLKPGQQFDSSFIFNLENNKIMREQSEFNHMAGISYNIVVEFQGGIVGSSETTVGDGVISTGSCQLSVIRENQRVFGIENKYKSKIVLQTAPLTTIANGFQTIINQDSGIADVGVDIDV